MNHGDKTGRVLTALTVAFPILAAAFLLNLWGKPPGHVEIPLVDVKFLSTTPTRTNYMDLVRMKEDLSDFDCYACHEKGKPVPLRYDTNHVLILPKEHANLVLGHGTHQRNNNCYNCHDEHNLERFQARDGKELTFAESTQLCGSCHGPTIRDWEAGVHGRTSGNWNHASPDFKRLDCVSCHNPHRPAFPGRAPAPAPHPLRAAAKHQTEGKH